MKKSIVLAMMLFASSAICAQPAKAPKEAEDFMARAEGCIHFGGEVPENPRTREEKQRAAQVAKKIKELCHDIKPRLTALKKKYSTNAAAMAKLAEAEGLLTDAGVLD